MNDIELGNSANEGEKEKETMIMFQSDYLEGAHEAVLRRLSETNLVQQVGYGEDEYCTHARGLIRGQVGDQAADVEFLAGGTQTNLTVISALLKPFEGVISADTGHIAVHETGAIEATGHKVLTVPNQDGKLTAEQVDAMMQAHEADETKEHTVRPGAVYISFATELGTLYSKSELKALSKVCRKHGLYLFMDGARLGYGLMSEKNDLNMADIYRCTDVFYIGGTKQGALLGEAVVFRNHALHEDFRYFIKQKGGMMAKGRILGIQFEALFEERKKTAEEESVQAQAAPDKKEKRGKKKKADAADCLYFELAAHADRLAMKLRSGLLELGFPFEQESFTNQQFPILPDKILKKLAKKYSYSFSRHVDDAHSAVRFCTSWATKEESVDALLKDLRKLMQ